MKAVPFRVPDSEYFLVHARLMLEVVFFRKRQHFSTITIVNFLKGYTMFETFSNSIYAEPSYAISLQMLFNQQIDVSRYIAQRI